MNSTFRACVASLSVLFVLSTSSAFADEPKPSSTAPSVQNALDWLAANQEADGHWDCAKHGGGKFDLAVTGLAVMAFLDGGDTPAQGKHKDVVRKAVAWLQSKQSPNGLIGTVHAYEGAIGFLALARAYYATHDPALKDTVQKAVEYAQTSQNEAGGWDYTPHTQRNDTCVSSWWLRGLIYAKAGGLKVNDVALKDALALYVVATGNSGVCVYTLTGGTADDLRENRKTAPDTGSAALTGISLLVQQMLGQKRSDPVLIACANRTQTDLPNAAKLDLYGWYQCTLGLAMLGGDNPNWIHYRWYVKTALEEAQFPGPDKPKMGSLEARQERLWSSLGAAGQTALAAQILSACYNCPPGTPAPLPGVPRLTLPGEILVPK